MNTELINKLVGIPWKDGGRTLQEGFDCWGFFKWFYSTELGIAFDFDFLYSAKNIHKTTRKINTVLRDVKGWLRLAVPVQYCGVAMSKNKKIHHVGIWIDGGCLHCVEGQGVVFNTLAQLKRNGYHKIEYYTCL